MNNVLKELESTKSNLLQVISSAEQEKFNDVPFEGSWTAGQVSEHILKAIGTDLLYGNVKPTERNPDEKIAETGKLFLNFDIKMKSPEFILPSDTPKNKETILHDVEKSLNRLTEAAKTLDLSVICLDFELPGFGEFTRLEWIWFYIFHTQRHIHQLKNIEKAFAN